MTKYRPRLDFVVLKVVGLDKSEGGVVLPKGSKEGTKTIVVAVGPKVEDLKAHDEVFVIGTPNEDIVLIPREKDMVITREANVVLVINKEGQDK